MAIQAPKVPEYVNEGCQPIVIEPD